MSRPFSYNDENFTVIGNVCFGHILAQPTSANEIICEIPPEIGSRLIQKSAQGVTQTYTTFGGSGGIFNGKIILQNNRYYLTSNSNSSHSRYVMFYLFLKDI